MFTMELSARAILAFAAKCITFVMNARMPTDTVIHYVPVTFHVFP